MGGLCIARAVGMTTGPLPIISTRGSVLWTLAILAIQWSLGAAHGSEPNRMVDIVQNIRTNEQLYNNLEVVANWSFRINEEFKKEFNPWGLVDQAERTIRNVYQGGMCYLRTDGAQRSLDQRSVSLDLLLGFDGEKTRVVDQGVVANIVDGRIEHASLIRPHALLLDGARVYFPLSVYLEAGDALKGQPLAGPYAKRTRLTVRYESEEVVGGLNCFKVRCETQSNVAPPKGGKASKPRRTTPADVRFIWLATDRNYLPVRTEFYHTAMKVDRPVEVGASMSYAKLRPGYGFRSGLHLRNTTGRA